MTLGTFHTQVQNAIGRGTSVSSSIPEWTERAAQFLERNYTYQYMKRYLTLTIDPDADYPAVISIGEYEFKKLRSIRYVPPEGGRFQPLERIEPEQRTTFNSDTRPSGYWMDGVSNLVLDAIPTEALVLHIHADLFTTWVISDSWDHYLLRRGRDLLFPRTMMNAARELRDPKMFETHKTDLLDAITTFNVAEEDLQHGGKIEKMEYSPSFEEFEDFDTSE